MPTTISPVHPAPSRLVPRPRKSLATQLGMRRRAHPSISVVIPTYNEAANLPYLFEALPPVDEVIIVDGHSTDGTVDVARRLRPDATVVMQTRRGKGNALACGFAAATGDIIVMIDADLSTDPAEIPRFVQALLDGADYAKGSRFTAGGGSNDITPARRLGNKALNGLVNMLYGTEFTDLCYGYNAFWRYVLPVLGLAPGARGDEMLWGDGFEIETIINTRAAKAGLRIAEVPSHEANRLHGTSNLHAVRDGLRVLKAIRKERSQPVVPVERPASVGHAPEAELVTVGARVGATSQAAGESMADADPDSRTDSSVEAKVVALRDRVTVRATAAEIMDAADATVVDLLDFAGSRPASRRDVAVDENALAAGTAEAIARGA